MAKQHPLVIEVSGYDDGRAIFYSKGHHDKQEFMAAVGVQAEEYEIDTKTLVEAHHKHGRVYWDFEYEGLRLVWSKPGRGAFPVTVTEQE